VRSRDVFICHAHADKITHAGPLYRELNRRGLSCWSDEAEILPGDSIVEKVGEGLRSSRYVLIVVTKNFLRRSWPEKELNVAFSREMRTGVKSVVTLLDVDPAEYFERYPLLEDKLYVDWAHGLESLADGVTSLFSRRPSPEWHCDHPQEHVGVVWVRVVPAPENVGVPHRLVLRWGPYYKEVGVAASDMPTSLVHHKTNPDAVTFYVSVTPSAVITFGCGAPPDANYLNVDEGWTRSTSGNEDEVVRR
jgi:hypothetical protein